MDTNITNEHSDSTNKAERDKQTDEVSDDFQTRRCTCLILNWDDVKAAVFSFSSEAAGGIAPDSADEFADPTKRKKKVENRFEQIKGVELLR